MAVETFTGPKFDVVPGCFVTQDRLAREYVAGLRNSHRIFELPNNLAVVHTEDVPVRNLPLHIGSWADYCIDVIDGLDRVLLWFIDPPVGSPPLTTSEHHHPKDDDEPDKPGIPELYSTLGGLLNLDVGKDPDNKTTHLLEGSLENPAEYTILAGDWHQGKTVKGPVTVVIRMYNAALYPLDKQHIRR